MKRLAIIIAAVLGIVACNNYGVAGKLENPSNTSGGSSSQMYYIFVSSRTTAGNMSSLNNGNCTGGGLAQADCSCRDASIAGGLNSGSVNYIAWLSTPTSEMRCRISNTSGVGCSPTGSNTWYNTLGQPVFTSYSAMFSGSLATQIISTEYKQPPTVANVWTGTGSNGGATGNNCSNWTSNSAGLNGDKGDVGANTSIWTANNYVACNTPLAVYCIAAP